LLLISNWSERTSKPGQTRLPKMQRGILYASVYLPERLEGKPAIYNYMKNVIAQMQNWIFTNVREYQTSTLMFYLLSFLGKPRVAHQRLCDAQKRKDGKIIHYREYWNPVLLNTAGSTQIFRQSFDAMQRREKTWRSWLQPHPAILDDAPRKITQAGAELLTRHPAKLADLVKVRQSPVSSDDSQGLIESTHADALLADSPN